MPRTNSAHLSRSSGESSSSALRNTKTPVEYRGVIESSLEEILRMTTIVDNLLMLAKADQSLFHPEFSEVDFQKLVEELYEDGEVLAEPKHIRVTLLRNEPIIWLRTASASASFF